MAKMAIDLNQNDFAFKKIKDLAAVAVSKNDFLSLYRAHSVFKLLPKNYILPDSIPSVEETRESLKRQLEWDEIITEIKKLFLLNSQDTRLVALNLEERIDLLGSDRQEWESFYFAKSKVGLARYKGQNEAAVQWQSKVIDCLEQMPGNPMLLVKEMSRMANMAGELRDWDSLRKWTLRLGSLELPPAADLVRKLDWTATTLIYGIESGQFESALSALPELRRLSEWHGDRKAILFHAASVICLYSNMNEEASKWANDLMSFSAQERTMFTWQPLLVMYVASLQKGEKEPYGSIETYLWDRFCRALGHDLKTPKVFAQMVKSYLLEGSKDKLENGLSEILRLKDSQGEHECYKFFHFEHYLFALLKNVETAEILANPFSMEQHIAKNHLQ